MRTSEVRRRFLDFFARKQHEIVPSASLVSADPSILFTIAGMVPFIPYIVGTERSPWPRVASVQKCIRTNDIENVGRTTRHGTFFQMAGNFSFGDYFKEQAIPLAWELLTSAQADGGYGLAPERLWATVWEEDQEALRALVETVGLPRERIALLPRAESFWDTGQRGPAGPTCEWFYDRGDEFGPDATCGPHAQWPAPAAEDRYIEVWNLVFDEFLRGEGSGKDYPLLGELDFKSIDTGLGIERLAYILQGKHNMYEIDEVFPVIERTEQLTGRTYGADAEDDVRMRVIADHVRSALMLVGDGVRPGNEGRGYVLRRLIRRAVRSIRLLGFDRPAMPELLPISSELMGASYPVVREDFDRIFAIVCAEEDAFLRTLETGTVLFNQVATDVTSAGGATVPGADAFRLHDTYGFPIDLTLEMAQEVGLRVDEEGFRTAMTEQRDRARADAAAKKTGHTDTALYNQLLSARDGQTVPFLGYTEDTAAVTVESVLTDGRLVQRVESPADVEVILDRTPFYAEMGGQLADRGRISLEGGGIIEVDDVQAPVKGLTVHRGRLVEGVLEQGSPAIARIDVMRRGAIARAHTATHMVHKALREELGDSATQAGSENSPGRLRFDFRFGSSVPRSSLEQVEGRVNTLLQDELEVTDQQMPIDQARAAGAMALFGEKYGDIVRVVSIGGDWSRELCAGTHVRSTGYLGTVQLMGEASIGSGVRRVDALVGQNAYRFQAKEHALVSQLSELMRVGADDLPERVRALTQRVKDMDKQLAAMRGAQLQAQAGTLAAQAVETAGIRLLVHDAAEGVSAGDLRTLATDLRARLGDDEPAVVAVAGSQDSRAALVIATNAPARAQGLAAGALLRVGAEAMGGRGGGKDDLAQGGGGDPQRTGAALDAVRKAVTAAGRQ